MCRKRKGVRQLPINWTLGDKSTLAPLSQTNLLRRANVEIVNHPFFLFLSYKIGFLAMKMFWLHWITCLYSNWTGPGPWDSLIWKGPKNNHREVKNQGLQVAKVLLSIWALKMGPRKEDRLPEYRLFPYFLTFIKEAEPKGGHKRLKINDACVYL